MDIMRTRTKTTMITVSMMIRAMIIKMTSIMMMKMKMPTTTAMMAKWRQS
jgi:hypothetical protein